MTCPGIPGFLYLSFSIFVLFITHFLINSAKAKYNNCFSKRNIVVEHNSWQNQPFYNIFLCWKKFCNKSWLFYSCSPFTRFLYIYKLLLKVRWTLFSLLKAYTLSKPVKYKFACKRKNTWNNVNLANFRLGNERKQLL